MVIVIAYLVKWLCYSSVFYILFNDMPIRKGYYKGVKYDSTYFLLAGFIFGIIDLIIVYIFRGK